ncbi:MAG: cobalamin B12-binding domain-containing protein, partial [Candidatus Wallbacteria bacterium]|nr:cobalamin B12-binding domain-containing protein [Candidatus Wallbacteria bacterium]
MACPPWRTECPNLALAYLSAMLRANDVATWVADLNILLYKKTDEVLRRYWDLTSSAFWGRPEGFKSSFSPSMMKVVDDLAEELAEREGDLVGFSTQSANVMFTLEMVRRLRARGCRKTIVLGGPAVRLRTPGRADSVGLIGFRASGLDEAAVVYELGRHLDLVDVLVEGEGEETLLELAQRQLAGVALDGTPGAVVWNHGKPPPFVSRPAIANLDLLP